MTDENDNNFPDGLKLGGEGRQLWAWLVTQAENIEDCRPLATELCRICDRLAAVRAKITEQGLMVSGARGRSAKNPLIDIEVKLSKQYQTLWRALGLSDKPPDDTPPRPVGRPPHQGAIWQD